MKYEQTRETHKIWGGNLNYSFLGWQLTIS